MKVGIFITARLKSSRLAQKILLDLNGKTVIDHIIERAKLVNGVDGVVLCTSNNPQDSILYDYALKHNIQYYIGSEDDVLQRLCDAANYYHYDAFVSVTADNPLFSFYMAQLYVEQYKRIPFDFGRINGLPLGIGTYFIDKKALEVAILMKKRVDTEIWGPFTFREDFFNILHLEVENSPFKEDRRLTIDYPEDYQLFLSLYSKYNVNDVPNIQRVFNLLKAAPYLWKLNDSLKQTYPNHEELEIIRQEFDKSKENGLKFAKSIQKKLTPNLKVVKVKI